MTERSIIVRQRRYFNWPEICDEVKAHAPEWVEVGIASSSTATLINQGRYKYVNPQLFEARMKATHEYSSSKWARLHLRYTGELEEA